MQLCDAAEFNSRYDPCHYRQPVDALARPIAQNPNLKSAAERESFMTIQDAGRMNNPFPGMNPYLEAHWWDVHASLVIYIRNQLQRKLPPGLVARAEEGVTLDEAGEPLTYRPDVLTRESGEEVPDMLRESVDTGNGDVDVMEPFLVVAEPQPERWVEIRELNGRVVTVIEVLSPSNKSGEGLLAHRRKRGHFLAGGANFVEIDLLREGGDALGLPWKLLPAQTETTYRACVRRPDCPGQAEVYLLPLRRRLPGFRIPLRKTDADVVLDLQPLVELCFQDGGYASLDVSRDPEPPLPSSDTQWLDECLRRAGLRK